MKIISHRGNLNGSKPEYENTPSYIDQAINTGFDVEVDIWCLNNTLYLGHDYPEHIVEISWLEKRKNYLWIHCKNHQAMSFFNSTNEFNYFWHQNDDLTITSKKYIWCYPGIFLEHGVTVELSYKNDIPKIWGVCTDTPIDYQIITQLL